MENEIASMKFSLDFIPGPLGDALRDADARNQKRIQEIGLTAFERELETKRLREELKIEREANARRARRLLESSGLGKRFFSRTFETFKKNSSNEKAYTACQRILLRQSKGVLLTGKNGIGKTHLAAAVVNAETVEGRVVRFGNVVDLMERYGNDVTQCDLVCIDDLGQEYAIGYKQDDARVFVYKTINKLYEQDRGIFITTNLSAKQLREKYGAAVISRLQEMCEFICYDDVDRRSK